MLEKIINTKINIKLVILLCITLFFYTMLIYSLFFIKNIAQSLLFIFLFFISFHFFFIEISQYKIKNFFIIALILSIIDSFIIGFGVRQYIVSLFVFNFGVVILISKIMPRLKKEISLNNLKYFSAGGFIFTVSTAIIYSFILIGTYNKIPFECEDLSRISNDVIDSFTKSFKIGLNKNNEIKSYVDGYLNTSLKDKILKNTIEKPQTKLKKTLIDYNKKVLYKLTKDNNSINIGICDSIIGEINYSHNKPIFQFSLIFFMSFLFYPFLRITYWILTRISMLLFRILFLLKIYKIKKIINKVDDISDILKENFVDEFINPGIIISSDIIKSDNISTVDQLKRILEKLVPYRDLAQDIIVLIKSDYADKKTIDRLIYIISQSIKIAKKIEEKKTLNKSLKEENIIKTIEENERNLDDEKTENLLNNI